MKEKTRALLKEYILSFSMDLSKVKAMELLLRKEKVTTDELVEEIGRIMKESRVVVPVYNEKDYERDVSC